MTARPKLIGRWAAAAALALGTLLWAAAAEAIDIQKVVSPGGITAWLVEDETVPLISMSYAFEGGAAQDPANKPGVANMLSGLLDEGAGNLDSKAFQARLDALSIAMGFDASRDSFDGSLRTLSANRDEAAHLLRLALSEPHFDAEPVARIRAQILAAIKRSEGSPGQLAANAMMRATFPDHPYGRPVEGTADSVAAITVDDLRQYRQKVFARDKLKVSIVGAIDAKDAAAMLDTIFGDLPAKGDLVAVPDVTAKAVGQIDVALPAPQTVIRIDAPGLKRDDADLIPAVVANYILGGGSNSRLFKAVREQRGLAYSVGLGLDPLEHSGVVAGGTETRSGQADAVIALIKQEIARFAKDGPTPQELATAKDYLIGSYPLRFVTSAGIADQLLGIQLDGWGIDYPDRRNGLVAAVTIDDVRRVAQRLFGSGDLTVVQVGPSAS
jgi:zinc protease